MSNHRQYDDEGREVNNVTFSFNGNESEGTIKYFSLSYPIIDALDHGKRLVVDELDSKLHPLLIRKIITLFNSSETNPKGAQLLFTTHDTFLLGAGLFRRDQVWFTQKDSFGATEAYSLAEYKVRGNSPFEKEYLQGKFGATPIIGEMETIFIRRVEYGKARKRDHRTADITRRQGIRNIKQSFLIVCEGVRTEPEYFKAFRITTATVKAVGQAMNTVSLVNKAVSIRDADRKRNAVMTSAGLSLTRMIFLQRF